jgi:hypothetical protein
MSAMGLNTEGEGSAMAFLRRGYKVRRGWGWVCWVCVCVWVFGCVRGRCGCCGCG